MSTVMYTAFGNRFKFGTIEMPASGEDFSFAKHFFHLVENMVTQVRVNNSQCNLFLISDFVGPYSTPSFLLEGRGVERTNSGAS